MATHGQGPGKKAINLVVPEAIKTELADLATRSGMSLNDYCSTILQEAAAAALEIERIETNVFKSKRGHDPTRTLIVKFSGDAEMVSEATGSATTRVSPQAEKESTPAISGVSSTVAEAARASLKSGASPAEKNRKT